MRCVGLNFQDGAEESSPAPEAIFHTQDRLTASAARLLEPSAEDWLSPPSAAPAVDATLASTMPATSADTNPTSAAPVDTFITIAPANLLGINIGSAPPAQQTPFDSPHTLPSDAASVSPPDPTLDRQDQPIEMKQLSTDGTARRDGVFDTTADTGTAVTTGVDSGV
jgi:hypothetical protein